MSEWQTRIEEDPEVVFKEEEFQVRIPRPFGGLIFYHNKPVHVQKIIPPNPNRKKNNENVIDDLDATVFWLTGGPDGLRSEETDIYGVVALRLDLDVSSALADIALFAESDSETNQKKAAKSYQEMQKELVNNTKTALKEARELADFRVRRALKITHMNLMKQYETLRQDGKGVYSPSVAEAVGAHILAAELDKAGANRKKMVDRLSQVMNNTTIIG